MSLEPGYAVTPNVRLSRKLGEGGMGSVWVAEHLTLKTEVAVKFIAANLDNEVALKRFSREAELAARIKSPHVVQTFDHGATDDGLHYIVMELLEGVSLEDRLERGTLAPRQVAMLVSQVCKALMRAHELGIVHRDLKPANLFLVDSGYEIFTKVLDFGIAKRTQDDEMALTDSRSAIGTPFFMSPEALRARPDLDHRTDLWSLSVVAYLALTGEIPFRGNTFGDQLMCVHEGKFTPPSEKVKSISKSADEWFTRAFSRSVDDRFESAAQLSKTFRHALGGVSSSTSMDDDMPASRGADSDDWTVPSEQPISTEENAITVDARVSTDSDTVTSEVGIDEEREAVQQAVAPSSSGMEYTDETNVVTGAKATTFEGAASSTADVPLAKRRPWLMLGAAVAAAAVGAYIGLQPPSKPTPAAPAPTPTQTTAPAEPKETPPAPVPSETPPAAPTHVSIVIDSVPPHVSVRRGQEELGKAPGPISLPAGEKEVELTFSMPGYISKTKKMKIVDGQPMKVTLKRVPAPKPKKGREW